MDIRLVAILQIVCIIVSVLGFLSGFYLLTSMTTFPTFVMGFFIVLFSVLLLLAEIYVFSFFKYFSFLLTNWGKAIMYFFLGSLFYNPAATFNVILSFLYWILAGFFLVMTFVTGGVAKPLFQAADQIQISTNTNDFFEA